MHGVITPALHQSDEIRKSIPRAVQSWMRKNVVFMLVVILPTLICSGYYFIVAADQYESEAHFLVRSADKTPAVGAGIGQVLSLAGGLSASQSEAMGVADYLTSHDAVGALRRKAQLVERFRRPEADFLSRLRYENPLPETLLKYYRRQIDVRYNTDTGITTLRVRAFRPGDAFRIAQTLLLLGEERVNALNARSYRDAIALSRQQLQEAEEAMALAQRRLTHFRQSRGDIDPRGSAEAQLGVVSNLTQGLARARAQLAAMTGLVRPSSPQYVALAAQVRALEAQVAAQSGRLAGTGATIASGLGDYEELRIRQQFAAKRYETAAAGFEKARDEATKQQLYIVRIVEANMPGKSLFPERWRIVATVFFGLLITYSIGWLIAAGVREHAA